MEELIKGLGIPTVLVIGGILFLLLATGVRIKFIAGEVNKRYAWGLGLFLLVAGVVLSIIPILSPTPTPTKTPVPPTPIPYCPSITEPVGTVQCPSGDCIFEVKGCFPKIATDVQTVVIFIDPGGENYFPQKFDFPVEVSSDGKWRGKAKVGEGYQSNGTTFHILVLLMKKDDESDLKKDFYKIPPSSDASFGPVLITVK